MEKSIVHNIKTTDTTDSAMSVVFCVAAFRYLTA